MKRRNNTTRDDDDDDKDEAELDRILERLARGKCCVLTRRVYMMVMPVLKKIAKTLLWVAVVWAIVHFLQLFGQRMFWKHELHNDWQFANSESIKTMCATHPERFVECSRYNEMAKRFYISTVLWAIGHDFVDHVSDLSRICARGTECSEHLHAFWSYVTRGFVSIVWWVGWIWILRQFTRASAPWRVWWLDVKSIHLEQQRLHVASQFAPLPGETPTEYRAYPSQAHALAKQQEALHKQQQQRALTTKSDFDPTMGFFNHSMYSDPHDDQLTASQLRQKHHDYPSSSFTLGSTTQTKLIGSPRV